MSRKARKCSGSLFAMTPSKSKTTALSATLGVRSLQSLAGPDGNRQPVFPWWIGTLVGLVVVAVRLVGAVEIQNVRAGRVAVEIDIPAGGIGFRAAGQIAEEHEEVVEVRGRRLDEDG